MRLFGIAVTAVAGLLASGCSEQNASAPPAGEAAGNSAIAPAGNASTSAATAAAELRDAQGQVKGSATATQAGTGIAVRLEASGMPAGTYAAHVHTVGACDPPKFETAGGHWNPTDRQHGKENPAGSHKGDLDNLTIGADGRGAIEFTMTDTMLTGGTAALLDADGAAILIHAKPDDYRTDPAGDAGDRIACGVFR